MSEAEDLTTTVGRLRGEINTYRDRYGDLDEFKPLERLDHAIVARRARLRQLQKMAAEIDAEIRTVQTEVAGIERGVAALLGELLPRIEHRYAEAWSPTPVLGFRIWALNEGELHGVRVRWEAPSLTATCEASRADPEIPHSDGRCGRLGCGIYAAKSARRLLDEFAPALRSAFAVGLVGLSGKVVEHEHGYRGAEATVLALVVVENMRAEFTADPARLAALFDGGGMEDHPRALPDLRSLHTAIVEYLTEQERIQNPWT